jgi:tetratricopeptide (TPR) repeat protein
MRRATNAVTVESSQPGLRQALGQLQAGETADAHLRVGLAYYGAGVLDSAIGHFDRALRLEPRLAAAYDARARVWRQWRLLGPAVADANRAVFFSPGSAEARNTLGTILAALGDRTGAAGAYRCALQLDSTAEWARINLNQLGDVSAPATADCTRAKAKP